MDNFVIAINKEVSLGLDRFLNSTDYYKNVSGEVAHYEFKMDDWKHPHNSIPSEIMTYLITVVGIENYAFVRIGDSPDDIEIHGTMENFGMYIDRSVVYA